jgi:mannose-1-phosphate guanylyltransferase
MTETTIKTAMVLAAGRGERMLPLSEVLPKPALPLPDGPVVASALRLAATAGATRIVVNASHFAERMADAVKTVAIDGAEIVLSFEDQLMGTAGGLALARDRGLLGDNGPVLVINGDGVLGLDLQSLWENFRANDNLVTLALLPHLDPERWSRVVVDTTGKVRGFRPPGLPEAAEVPFLYPGVMAVHRDAIDALPLAPGEIPSALWEPARSLRRLGGVVVAGHWREIGTPADYLEVMSARLAGTTVIDSSADVGPAASVTRSFVGRGAVISDGAVVEASVVAEGATVRGGARVESSVLLGEVEVAQNSAVVGEILAQAPGP